MRYLVGLQYLRATAALGVVGFHASGRAHISFDLGQAGVDLFFILSGFLMWSITETPIRPTDFFVGRIRRIVPTYWIATGVMLLGALMNLFPAITLTTTHVLSSFLFIPTFSPSNGHIWPLLVAGWTLNYEMFFYLVFSLALFFPRKLQLAIMTAVFCGLVISGAFIRSPLAEVAFYTDPIILEFLAGALIASISLSRLKSAKLGICLIVTAFLWLLALEIWIGAPRIIAWGIPASLLIIGIISIERSNSLPNLPTLKLLGDASYSIYLWHTLAISLVAKFVVPLNFPAGVCYVLLLAAGVFVGLLLFYLIERPILRYLSAPSERALGPESVKGIP